MPSHKKDLVRIRMEKTGESYQRALEHVRAQDDRSASKTKLESAEKNRALAVEDTAFSIAAVRAEENEKPERERLFTDRYAHVFAEAGEHAEEATQRYLDLPFFRDGVRLRTRFIDDFVKEGLATGLDQIVILGAGFDMRAMRMPEITKARATVYEIDSALQLARKRKILTRAAVKIPARVKHVAFDAHDFNADDFEGNLVSALEKKGFRRGAGAIFIWEGVIGYIDDIMIDRSLRFVVQAGGERCRLILTHVDASFAPEPIAAQLTRAGFSQCREYGSDEIWRRHLQGDPHPNAWAIKISTAIV